MNPTDAQLVQHLRGGSPAADARRIDEWLGESNDHRRRIDALRAIWNASAVRHSTDVDAIWSRVAERTTRADAPRHSRPAPIPRLALTPTAAPRGSILPLAAAAAIIVAATATFVYVERERIPMVRKPAPVADAPREYSTGRGERSTIHLADGTTVTLAPLTHVRLHPGFGTGARDVTIEGEAVLDGAHHAARPFRVFAGGAIAETNGARFSVRSLAGDAQVSIAVARGAVSLGPVSPARVIRAGGLGRLDANGDITSNASTPLAGYFGWAEGRLSFDDVPLAEVQRTLGRWYEVDLRVEDSALFGRRITARFEGQSIQSIVGSLAATLGAGSVEWRGTTATLRTRSP